MRCTAPPAPALSGPSRSSPQASCPIRRSRQLQPTPPPELHREPTRSRSDRLQHPTCVFIQPSTLVIHLSAVWTHRQSPQLSVQLTSRWPSSHPTPHFPATPWLLDPPLPTLHSSLRTSGLNFFCVSLCVCPTTGCLCDHVMSVCLFIQPVSPLETEPASRTEWASLTISHPKSPCWELLPVFKLIYYQTRRNHLALKSHRLLHTHSPRYFHAFFFLLRNMELNTAAPWWSDFAGLKMNAVHSRSLPYSLLSSESSLTSCFTLNIIHQYSPVDWLILNFFYYF